MAEHEVSALFHIVGEGVDAGSELYKICCLKIVEHAQRSVAGSTLRYVTADELYVTRRHVFLIESSAYVFPP